MSNGVFISTTALNSLSPAVRSAVLDAVGLPSEAAVESLPLNDLSSPAEISPTGEHSRDYLAQFSERQMRMFLEKVHPKTLTVLTAIADLGPQFLFGDLLSRLNIPREEWRSLSGVWSGLTKRTRTIGNDPQLILIFWRNWKVAKTTEEIIGEMHPSTHQALRQVLNKD